MTRVLVVCADRVGINMAGPAIRSWEMARLLSRNGHEVHLAAPERGDRDPDGFEIVVHSQHGFIREAGWADVIIVQGVVMAQYPALQTYGGRIVIDLYDPQVLEVLELFNDHPFEERMQQHKGHLDALLVQLQVGDFFLCASEKQRDYWLGCLSAADRVNPYTHRDDRLLRRLIDVAPFGISSEPPRHSGTPAMRGVLPGVDADSKIVIWAGGVYNWFDPLSLLRAWPDVVAAVPEARLVFMGMAHPNHDVPAMAMASKALELSEELGLRDKTVHFNMGWVPYHHRQDYLLESNVGVSTHFNQLETLFSFRTRILDYIWSGLPVVSTEGDEFARWIAANGTGRVVAYDAPSSIAGAVSELLTDTAAYQAAADAVVRAGPGFTWEVGLAPLARYCDDPWQAADHAAGGARSTTFDEAGADYLLGSMTAPRPLFARMRFFLQREGLGSLLRRVVRALRRRLAGAER